MYESCTFDEVIDFAIEREKEAVQFYKELQRITVFSVQKSVLREFEMMEHGHVTLLQNVKKRKSIAGLNPAAPPDTRLNEYLVPTIPVPEMTYQDILITAIKREQKSVELYSRLLEESTDPELKKIFKLLNTEEQKHRHHFEKLYEEDIQEDN